MCPIMEASEYPLHGFGIKLGDPAAFTYKFYANKKLSLAIDAGKSASALYSRYHRQKFDEYTQPDTLSEFQRVTYLTHRATRDLFIEAKLLYGFDASVIANGLQVYVGGGWQWRNTNITYEYLKEDGAFDNQIRPLNISRITGGPAFTLGIEYSYFDMPISAFMEMQVYFDALIDPGWSRFQGGVGIRYIF